jgi:hypothetical protein
MLAAVAAKENYQVVSVTDGREAYRLLKSDADFKVVVFNMAMPNLRGLDMRTLRINCSARCASLSAAGNVKGKSSAPLSFELDRNHQIVDRAYSNRRPSCPSNAYRITVESSPHLPRHSTRALRCEKHFY